MLQQRNTEATDGKREEAKADDSDDDADEQGRPKAEAREQERESQKHGQGWSALPDRLGNAALLPNLQPYDLVKYPA